jgi:membrane-bound serine protease (ClpP class)
MVSAKNNGMARLAFRRVRAYLSVMRRMGAIFGLLLAGLLACAAPPFAAAQSPNKIFVTDIKGAIGVATERQIKRALDQSEREKANALVILLDTPGGLVSATRNMVQDIVGSPVPVIIYVAPSGARAASAGTYLMYAAHIAAMAPGTNIGAATPISMTMPGMPGDPKKDGKDSTPSAAERKSINDMVAMLKSLAQLRGRNAEFAEKAVREAATFTAEEARREKVIEIIAANTPDLLAQADGRVVKVRNTDTVLSTKNATSIVLEIDWRTKLLSVITDPNVAFILFMIGIYGILFEFWHPGTLFPGVIGAVSLIVALIALSALPVHYGALALLLLGLALMAGEAFTPGVGILGIGGLIAFVVGAIFLFEGEGWDIDVALSIPVIAGATLATAVLIFGVAGAAIKARKRPPASGAEQMIGSTAQVVDWSGNTGHVRAQGEIWSARAARPLQPASTVKISGRDGLVLIVEP